VNSSHAPVATTRISRIGEKIVLPSPQDPIHSGATPPGRGGIGVVRLAGPQALAIAAPMLRLKHEMESGRAIFGELIEDGERIDQVVVTYFARPHSYTTDDIVEISAAADNVGILVALRPAS